VNPVELRTNRPQINPYLPAPARILRIVPMVPDNSCFELRFEDPVAADLFTYKPGQFVEISVIGTGEAPISLCSSPTRRGSIELCVRRMGRVTNALYRLSENEKVGIRGPYGNGFPIDRIEGNDLLLIAGGLGMAPLRSLLVYALDNRRSFGRIILFYGTRTPEDILFRDELIPLRKRTDVEVELIVQLAYKLKGALPWEGRTGMVTDLFDDLKIAPGGTFAIMCGPPVFYKYVLEKLLEHNLSKDRILMSLERRMECGIGKCGHCAIGYKYTCIDGPVFSYWDALNLPEMI
jgi:sulfhydrogenase subunit gamma (sulfur reductase)